jgi:hypothetical protein
VQVPLNLREGAEAARIGRTTLRQEIRADLRL